MFSCAPGSPWACLRVGQRVLARVLVSALRAARDRVHRRWFSRDSPLRKVAPSDADFCADAAAECIAARLHRPPPRGLVATGLFRVRPLMQGSAVFADDFLEPPAPSAAAGGPPPWSPDARSYALPDHSYLPAPPFLRRCWAAGFSPAAISAPAPQPSHPWLSPYLPVANALVPSALRSDLAGHPDISVLLHVASYGADMLDEAPPRRQSLRNHPPAKQAAPFVSAYLRDEVVAGHMVRLSPGVFPASAPLLVAPLSVVPKGEASFRLISDLSAGPAAHNSAVRFAPLEPLRLASPEAFTARALHLGAGGETPVAAKLDVAHAYRNIPVAARDSWALAHGWDGHVFMHRRLPFGAAAAGHWMCLFSNAVADVLAQAGGWTAAYIDDFLLVEPSQPQLLAARDALLRVLRRWGLPVCPKKFAREATPTRAPVILGIQASWASASAGPGFTVQVAVTPDRLARLRAEVASVVAAIGAKRPPSAKSLASLAGKLSFAAFVVPLGRPFLTRLHLSAAALSAGERARVPWAAVADDLRSWLEVWLRNDPNGRPPGRTFCVSSPLSLPVCVGPGLRVGVPTEVLVASGFLPPPTSPRDNALPAIITTDASGWGFGAVLGARAIMGAWSDQELTTWVEGRPRALSINLRELAAALMALLHFAPVLRGRRVLVGCDNLASVFASHSGRSSDPLSSVLLRLLSLVQTSGGFSVTFCHLPGVLNPIADALSRNRPDSARAARPALRIEPLDSSTRTLAGWPRERWRRRPNMALAVLARRSVYGTLSLPPEAFPSLGHQPPLPPTPWAWRRNSWRSSSSRSAGGSQPTPLQITSPGSVPICPEPSADPSVATAGCPHSPGWSGPSPPSRAVEHTSSPCLRPSSMPYSGTPGPIPASGRQ